MSDVQTFPWCGACWCQNETACPYNLQPTNVWPNSTIEFYTSQKPTFLYELSCDPYEDSACETTPPQAVIPPDVDPSEVVCAYKYTVPRIRPSCGSLQYTMVTYNSVTDAEKDGAYPTHYGRCGTCSSTRDLALYLSKCNFHVMLFRNYIVNIVSKCIPVFHSHLL